LGRTLEDEDIEDEPEEEPLNGLVEALFDEIERLRLQVRFCARDSVTALSRSPNPSSLNLRCDALWLRRRLVKKSCVIWRSESVKWRHDFPGD
jgi:hypothetical protein